MNTDSARRTGRPPAAEGDASQTRARIIEAATEIFADKGFHGAGVAEIGDRAGVQRGALYYHIKSKEELLWEVLRHYVTSVLESAEEITRHVDEPAVKLRRLIRDHVVLIIQYRRQVRIQFRDGSALTGNRADTLQDLRDRVQHIWQQTLDDGCAAGTFTSSDHVITNSLLGMVNMAFLWYRPDGDRAPEEIADLLADFAFSGLETNRKVP